MMGKRNEIRCKILPGGFLLSGRIRCGTQEPLTEGENCAGDTAGRNTEIGLKIRAERTGKDWTVIFTGGTASVLNVTGHKDEEICRHVAERLSAETGRTVVCTGGVHLDGITPEEIGAVREAAGRMTERLIEEAVRQEKEGKTDER